MVVALNMTDMAKRQGIVVDAAVLSRELGVPVIETVGGHAAGRSDLLAVDTRRVVAAPLPLASPPGSTTCSPRNARCAASSAWP